MRKYQLLLIAIILLNSLKIQGQKLDKLLNVNYKAGMVILNSGDTLRGSFEFNDCKENYQLLVYIDPLNNEKSAFEPQQVYCYMIDSLLFFPKELKEGWEFLRLIYYDNLKIFLRKRFFTSNVSSGTENQIMYEKPDGKYILVSFDNFYPFKTKVGDFFSDDTDLANKIRNNTLTKKDILKIAIEYNEWYKQNKK